MPEMPTGIHTREPVPDVGFDLDLRWVGEDNPSLFGVSAMHSPVRFAAGLVSVSLV